jgi:hypothetical protein
VKDMSKFIVLKPPKGILSAAAMTMMPAHAAASPLGAQRRANLEQQAEWSGVRQVIRPSDTQGATNAAAFPSFPQGAEARSLVRHVLLVLGPNINGANKRFFKRSMASSPTPRSFIVSNIFNARAMLSVVMRMSFTLLIR